MQDARRGTPLLTYVGLFVLGCLTGAAGAWLMGAGSQDEAADGAPVAAPREATPNAREPSRTERSLTAARARIDELDAQVLASHEKVVALTAERDEAREKLAHSGPSLLDLIAAVSPEDGYREEKEARGALEAARRNQLEVHWEDVLGPGIPRVSSDLQSCFARFYAELRRPRTPEQVQTLYREFAELYAVRLEVLRRRDAALRSTVPKAEYPEASADLRRDIWSAGLDLLTALQTLVDEDERTELRLRGCQALGIPDPLERLRLGWTRLVGDDLPAPPQENLTDGDRFGWIYICLERERTREELRAICARLRQAQAAETENSPSVYESVKELLTAREWKRLRYHPEGALPLSR